MFIGSLNRQMQAVLKAATAQSWKGRPVYVACSGNFTAERILARCGVDHTLLSEHLTSELRIRTEGRGRKVDEWKLKPAAVDNHWLDCLVGCAVAASMCGVTLPGLENMQARRRRGRLKLSELQQQRNLERSRA